MQNATPNPPIVRYLVHCHLALPALEGEQPLIADLVISRWKRAVELAWPDEYDDAFFQPGAGSAQAFSTAGPTQSVHGHESA